MGKLSIRTQFVALIEAARAGEQGQGFVVVAAEVRSLAQRSATASKEIRQLILDSAGRIDAGSREVGEAGETMAEIVTAVKRVNDLIAEISSASQDQSQSLSQVSETVQQLEKVTQQNAAMVEQASAVSASMDEQASALARAVGSFRLRDARARSADALPQGARGPGSGAVAGASQPGSHELDEADQGRTSQRLRARRALDVPGAADGVDLAQPPRQRFSANVVERPVCLTHGGTLLRLPAVPAPARAGCPRACGRRE